MKQRISNKTTTDKHTKCETVFFFLFFFLLTEFTAAIGCSTDSRVALKLEERENKTEKLFIYFHKNISSKYSMDGWMDREAETTKRAKVAKH